MKSIIFFIIVFSTISYLFTFWQNRDKRVKFHMFGQEIEINLGILSFGIFIDGAIITTLIIWLLT